MPTLLGRVILRQLTYPFLRAHSDDSRISDSRIPSGVVPSCPGVAQPIWSTNHCQSCQRTQLSTREAEDQDTNPVQDGERDGDWAKLALVRPACSPLRWLKTHGFSPILMSFRWIRPRQRKKAGLAYLDLVPSSIRIFRLSSSSFSQIELL